MLFDIWDLPRPGIEPMPPALQGGFLTTGPPGKPKLHISNLVGKWKCPCRECKACCIVYGKLRHTCDYALLLLPGESHRQRSLGGYSPWGRKESDTTEATSHSTAHGTNCRMTCCGWSRAHETNFRDTGNHPSCPLPRGSCRCASVAL